MQGLLIIPNYISDKLCFDKSTNFTFQPGQCIVTEGEWKNQNEIRFYELSSHQCWEPTAVLKIRGKDPHSYSKWIKGFRQNLKGNRGGLTMKECILKILFRLKFFSNWFYALFKIYTFIPSFIFFACKERNIPKK